MECHCAAVLQQFLPLFLPLCALSSIIQFTLVFSTVVHTGRTTTTTITMAEVKITWKQNFYEGVLTFVIIIFL